MKKFSTLLLLLSSITIPALAQVTFNSSFESGNATNFEQIGSQAYTFEIEQDSNSTDRQWFYFEVNNAERQTLEFTLTGTSETNVTGHWADAVPVFSTDGGMTWDHVSTTPSSTSNTYTFSHTFTAPAERFAFHHPYTFTRATEKLAEWEAHPDAAKTTLGNSTQGRPIDYLRITSATGDVSQLPAFWIIARQHAAEVTGSFSVEGFLDFVLSDDPLALQLRKNAIIHVVPCMNPDGVVLGNYRDNAAGVNLNRVWDGSANMTTSPEVKLVQDKLSQAIAENDGKYSFFIDLHSTSGDSPHFAFHANESQEPPLYPTPETYYEDVVRFLELVEKNAPQFDPNTGRSSSTDTRLSYHNERITRGVLAVIFEGGYIRQYHGPNPDDFMTPEIHRQVGEGIAKALIEYFSLDSTEPVQDKMIIQ